MDTDPCNTCGDSFRWQSTTEDAPTALVDLGACPDCLPNLDDWQTWPVVYTYPHNRPVRDTVQSADPAVYAHVYRYGSHRPRVQFFRTVDGIGQFIEERPL